MSKVVIGADNLGLPLKDILVEHLKSKGHEVVDIGTNTSDPVDYPGVGRRLAEKVAAGEFSRGILVCGTGAGMAIVANKVPGVRAVCVTDPYTAERAIASNNAQVITMGAQITGPSVAKMLADIYLSNEFQAERSGKKVAQIDQIDAEMRKAG
ncbi:RpiB/LacA/LacB family sugar-phosphate isomerase [Geminicoccus roseus]|uniref:RpiB/LacA/LacB family sugar-phosphate isomerase n=1 Tax=Geminicoccus roseus TaxID=404900 RepID=UPI0004169941|nr:RpiB/LacA/LacB family sugar-phosphate isomerase [Geminicoccus roseus]